MPFHDDYDDSPWHGHLVQFIIHSCNLSMSVGSAVVVADRHNLLRDLPRSMFALLPGHLLASLPGHLNGDAFGDVVASLLGDLPAVLLRDPLWHRGTLLAWDMLTVLSGNCFGDLRGQSINDVHTAGSSEAWAKLHDWASVASRGRLLLSGSVAHASLKTTV